MLRFCDEVLAALKLPRMTIVVADEVGKWIDANNPKNGREWSVEEYGCVTPPWGQYGIECTTSFDSPEYGRSVLQRFVLVENVSHMRGALLSCPDVGVDPEQVTWTIMVNAWWRQRFAKVDVPRTIIAYPGFMVLHLNEHGHILENILEGVPLYPFPGFTRRQIEEIWTDPVNQFNVIPLKHLSNHLPVALFTTRWLHDRVVVEKVEAAKAMSRQQRRAAERDGIPRNDYYLLGVNAPGVVRRGELPQAEPATAERKVREHVVRGHFKFYTKPLFGRKTLDEPLWVPSHTRGDPELGMVTKDYELHKT